MGACLSCLGWVRCKPPHVGCETYVSWISITTCNNWLEGRNTVDDKVAVPDIRDGDEPRDFDEELENSVQRVDIGDGDGDGDGLRDFDEELENNVDDVVVVPVPRVENHGTEENPIFLNFISGRSRSDFNGTLESLPIINENELLD